MIQNKIYIYGKHALTEAITSNSKALEEIFVAPQFDDQVLRDMVRKSSIKMTVLTSKTMPREVESTAVHQGIIGLLSFDKLVRPFEEFVQGLEVTADTSLVILGEINDPQNVGAIIRSAAAFGVSGVLIPEHNQAQVTGSVVKVSAGMAFKIPLVSVSNVNSAVRDLKERGFWVYGLEGESKQSITKENFDAPALFILGNEEKGIRTKTRDLCDILVSIPVNPRCESLNVGASAAVALYAWSAKHPRALRVGKK
ncbi:MAG: 23S rRNA (guanosine(2251)-2'-O)-methyltransferase RlmB [Patescibacteria group bacterium]